MSLARSDLSSERSASQRNSSLFLSAKSKPAKPSHRCLRHYPRDHLNIVLPTDPCVQRAEDSGLLIHAGNRTFLANVCPVLPILRAYKGMGDQVRQAIDALTEA